MLREISKKSTSRNNTKRDNEKTLKTSAGKNLSRLSLTNICSNLVESKISVSKKSKVSQKQK